MATKTTKGFGSSVQGISNPCSDQESATSSARPPSQESLGAGSGDTGATCGRSDSTNFGYNLTVIDAQILPVEAPARERARFGRGKSYESKPKPSRRRGWIVAGSTAAERKHSCFRKFPKP